MRTALARELLIVTLSSLLEGVRHVAVGASSPIPAAAAMLQRAQRQLEGSELPAISVLGSSKHNFYTNGSVELFDAAAQGRVDAFFLGGGQIDGRGNINLVGIGPYPQQEIRWPGSFGSAYLYFTVPRVILFREEHTPRVLVGKVDFISAPGISEADVFRPGGPYALLTGKALFRFDKNNQCFKLVSVHPGHDLHEVVAATGFTFEHNDNPPQTPQPGEVCLSLLRGPVLSELQETYPEFAMELGRELSEPSEDK